MTDHDEQWLVERYSPGHAEQAIRADLDDLLEACRTLAGSVDIELIDATWLPDDELVTALFTGTKSAVIALYELTGLGIDRLTRAIEMRP